MAEDELYVALIDVDLVAFDEPTSPSSSNGSPQGAPSRVRAAVRETSDLTALAVSMCAAVIAAGILHPVLAPTVLLAAAPQAWAQVKGAKLAFDSWLRTSSRARRLDVVSELISPAGERGRGAGVHHAGGAARASTAGSPTTC